MGRTVQVRRLIKRLLRPFNSMLERSFYRMYDDLDPADQHEIAADVHSRVMRYRARWHREFSAGLATLLAYGAPAIAVHELQTALRVDRPGSGLDQLIHRDFKTPEDRLTFVEWAKVCHSISSEMLKQAGLVPQCFSLDEWQEIVEAAKRQVEAQAVGAIRRN